MSLSFPNGNSPILQDTPLLQNAQTQRKRLSSSVFRDSKWHGLAKKCTVHAVWTFNNIEKEVAVGPWINSLRLSMCMLAGFLCITGFKISGTKISWRAVAAVFLIAGATMVQNDWRDRYHDAHKGKTFALQNPKAFIIWLISLWLVCAGLIVAASLQSIRLALPLVGMATIGVVYSETRKIPFAPNTLVAMASASPAILPFAFGAESNALWWLFLAVVLITSGREVIKDLDDSGIDEGYKWTLPLVVGERPARMLAAVLVAAGLYVLTYISASAAILTAALVSCAAVTLLVTGAKPVTSKRCLDISLALILLVLVMAG